eukprot:1635226-Amphidinium_carterae.1
MPFNGWGRLGRGFHGTMNLCQGKGLVIGTNGSVSKGVWVHGKDCERKQRGTTCQNVSSHYSHI